MSEEAVTNWREVRSYLHEADRHEQVIEMDPATDSTVSSR